MTSSSNDPIGGFSSSILATVSALMNDYTVQSNFRSNDAGWGPCAWVIISEVWPLSNRAYGIALGASANWMSNFIVGQITPDMLKQLKYGTFIFFGLLTFGGVLFIWLVVPETKRLTLEEMDILFGSVGMAQAVRNYVVDSLLLLRKVY